MRRGNPRNLLARAVTLVALATLAWSGSLFAQGVTTGAVRGKVTDEAGNPVVGAVLTLVNNSTGLRNTVSSREDGVFDVENVTPGGPFTLSAHAIGYRPAAQSGIRISLGQVVEVNLKLEQTAVELSAVSVTGEAENPLLSTARTGAALYITDSMIERLPTLSRNFTDFISTATQSGTGSSIAGQNNRFNNIQIDGGVNNDLFGLGSTGTPGGQVNERPISLEAVKEYQILIAPFDVRQGGFTGGLVNAITKSGTNEFHGSLFFYGQNQNFARSTINRGPLGTDKLNTFHEYQYGASFSGPIIRNRLQFFAAADIKSRASPFTGYLQGIDSIDKAQFGVVQSQADSVIAWSQAHLVDPGSAGSVTDNTPDHDIFVKLNAQVTQGSQVELSYNHVKASDGSLIRSNSFSSFRSGFELGNAGYTINNTTETTRLRYNAALGGRYTNELLLGYQKIRDLRNGGMLTPLIFVAGATTSGAIAIGDERFSQGNQLNQDNYEVTDNLTVGLAHHLITIGTHNEFFKFYNQFFQGSYGVWAFHSAAALYAGTPYHYEIALPLRPGGPLAQFNVNQYGLYAQDIWNVTPRLALTYGLRLDDPVLPDKPGDNAALDTVTFAHYTDDGSHAFADTAHARTADFSTAALWSPRLGFNYDLNGDKTTLIRGGVGVFTGRPPYVWVSNAYANSGLTQALLTCDSSTANALPPAFNTNLANQPTACVGTGTPATPIPSIVYFDHGFKFPQTLRLALGGDQQLPWGMVGTIDLLYTRTLDQFYLNDVNLRGVQSLATGEGGRLMYGTLAAASGRATPVRVNAGYADVIRQSNSSGDNSYSATLSLNKRFSNHISFNAGYTYSKTKDRECLTSSISNSNLKFAVLQGPLDNRPLATSCFDVPSKLALTGIFDIPLGFQASLTYTGFSGTPFTYTTNNDANADGLAGNDPIYVPRDSTDITLANPADWKTLNAYINSDPCLSGARGTLLQRNTCRNPWESFINARLSKVFPTISGQSFEISLDIFNLPNLISSSWGVAKSTTGGFENQAILNASGYDVANQRAIYKLMNMTGLNAVVAASTRYRLLLSGKYNF